MFRKLTLTICMLTFMGLGLSQLIASTNRYPYFCEEQLCCQDTYQGYPFSVAVAWDPWTIQCYYSTGPVGMIDYMALCNTSGCNGG